MVSVLERIADYKRREIAEVKAARPMAAVEAAARAAGPVRPFRAALAARMAEGRTALVAEIKKASPSKGLIRADFDPPALARAYEAGGAACLSVLTDGPSFQGSDDFLVAARAAVSLPVLRKDFLYEAYQVAETRALGADCILVIMAAVSDAEARELMDAARHWGLDALVEVHNESELDRALGLDADLVGINNRDLHTFETALDVTERLAPRVGGGVLLVSESGITGPADVARLAAAGVGAILVGESLMRQRDVEAATRAILTPVRQPAGEAANA